MHRRSGVASVLASLIVAIGLAPMATPHPAAAAGACGTYRSETTPPPTIRVFRTATGAVETVDFRAYVKNVLSREWISSWTTESLRAGALAVKHYAWYQVLHWRGYVNEAGACFDVFDSTRDQHYDPSRPTYAAMSAAVDATWGTLATKGGRVFATYYNAGSPGEACGANVNGWRMYQWGTQACGLAGKSAADIMRTYYSGVTISAAPPPAPPPPTPAPTPAPSPTRAPVPSATPAPNVPASTATPAPSPSPTITPAPAPVAAPAAAPGGGQAGLAAPPPPPPANPEPVVVTVAEAAGPLPTPEPVPTPPPRDLPEGHPALAFERDADAEAGRAAWLEPSAPAPARWATVRIVIAGLLSAWLDEWSGADGVAEQAGDHQLGRGDILDGQADGLEDRDRLGIAAIGPVTPDAADLDQAPLAD